jgi:hypothetical protein
VGKDENVSGGDEAFGDGEKCAGDDEGVRRDDGVSGLLDVRRAEGTTACFHLAMTAAWSLSLDSSESVETFIQNIFRRSEYKLTGYNFGFSGGVHWL